MGMPREILLGWAGLILGVISVILSAVGIIGESLALALFGLAFLLVVVGGLSLLYKMQGQLNASVQQVNELRSSIEEPPFTLLSVEKTLSFEDERGEGASFIDTRKIRANHKGQAQYWFKEIGSPYLVENILIDGDSPDDEELEAGNLRVCKSFPHPLAYRESFETTLTCNVTGAFPDLRESYVHKIVDDTERVQVRIKFHNGKQCLEAKALLGYGGGSYEPIEDGKAEAKLERIGGGREVRFQVENPQRGQHFRIEWRW